MRKLYKIAVYSALALALCATACQKTESLPPDTFACNMGFADSSSANPKNATRLAFLQQLVREGVPGISMAIITPAGTWLGAAGHASIYDDAALRPCTITRVGSTVKTMTAATVMLLRDRGLLALDDKIADHLSADQLKDLENADKATIRQLLNHSSGIYNYIQNLKFQTASINDLVREWQPEDLLAYARGQQAYFAPGEDVLYSNTNYVLLGMLIEKVTGKPFYLVFKEEIFIPLGMAHTQFAATEPVPANIARGYIDLYSNLNLLESTQYSGWDYYQADGGLISTPYDMATFLKGLMEGRLLKAETVLEMQSWQQPKDSELEGFAYGYGIFRYPTSKGMAIHHSGDAIGYYANMLYYPATKTCVVYAVNGNYGKIDELTLTEDAINRIVDNVGVE